MSKRLSIIAVLISALSATTASAGIALFTDGRSMKVSAYKLISDESIELTLKSGGSITVPLARVDRIVDDEVADVIPPAVIAEAKKMVDEGVFPKKSWHYSEASGPIFHSKYDKIIIEAAKKFDVDAALVSAVVKAESDYDPRTLSNKGARGLMQLMPATAARFGVTDAFDPVANIHAGTRYLRWLLQTFKDNADLAVAAYNAGEGNVWKYNGVPPFRETVNYINRIAKHVRKALEPAAAKPVETVAAVTTR
ncbi:MAG: hypothetical protein QOI24_3782 [Acidobacteriota bacterium]|nr:hypothetical protein [Acidobacteriota bacterium]